MEPRNDEPARRSSFEDFEIPVPAPSVRPRRSAIVVTAAAVLAVNGLLNVLLVALFRPSGSIVWLYLVLGALQLGTAALVVLLWPIGRTVGLALGGVGIVLALVRAPDDALSALLAVALNAFVVYALGVSGPSFRRG